MKYQAIIFDMDGVLIDSEMHYLKEIHHKTQKNYPWIKEEDIYPIVGMDGEATRVFFHKLTEKPLDDEAFDRELEEICRLTELYFPDVLYPEVPEVLKSLKNNGYKIALASSSSMKTIQRMLNECQLTSYFEFVISGEQFRESKPNPEIYLTTIKALGCLPEECLVVEDSPYGITAGVAAGAQVAARIDRRFSFDQSKAAYFINTLKDLEKIL